MGQVSNLANATAYGLMIRSGLKLGIMTVNASAEMPILPTWPPILRVDPAGGAKTILLPAEEEGLTFLIENIADANETITVQEDTSETTIGTIAQNGWGLFVCDGSTWYMVAS